MKQVLVLIGNFGSGKTELALNLALRAADMGKTLLIDIDLVNTYFRLTDRKKLIESRGIRLVSPNYAMANVEAMSLPAEVSSAFSMDWDTVIFDAAGDPGGATALGRYHADFAAVEPGVLNVYNVINVRRPMSGTAAKILSLMEELEQGSRLKMTGLINNSNLAELTSADDLWAGYGILKEISMSCGIPVSYTSGKAEILEQFLSKGPDMRFVGEPFEITPYLHRDWKSFAKFRV
jgi:hypothetical protein